MNRLVISEGQDLIDIAVMLYGSAESVFKLIDDNSDLITSINYELLAGDVIYYSVISDPVIIQPSKSNVKAKDIFKYVLVCEGQNLQDIALQVYGDVAGKFYLMDDNNLSSINATIPSGRKLKYFADKIINLDVIKIYAKNQTIVNTDIATTEGGVGSMGIEINFKVS